MSGFNGFFSTPELESICMEKQKVEKFGSMYVAQVGKFSSFLHVDRT